MPTHFRTYNILVLEDNEGDRHLIEEAFRECGHECVLFIADSISSALDLLGKQAFDMIISDMSVPSREGKSLIELVRANEHWKATPVIVLSGAYDAGPAYSAGANAFVSKSMDMDKFFSKIKALMHFWTQVAELPMPSEPDNS